jgi:hypothetical protein
MPGSLSSTATSQTTLTLSWTPSSGGVDGYRIYKNGVLLGQAGPTATSYPVTDMSCGQTAAFAVSAWKGIATYNESPQATTTGSTASCPTIPNSPSNLIVSGATTSALTLGWQDNSSNESGFKIYKWACPASGCDFFYLTSVGANVASYTQTGLSCGNNWNYYKVSAYNANGESAQAGWVQGTTAACPPSDLAVTASNVVPASPFTNDAIRYSITIQNVGSNPAGSFYRYWYLDDAPSGCGDSGHYSGWSAGLAPGATSSPYILIPPNTLSAGPHEVRVFLDSECTVPETDESNNIVSEVFTVTAPAAAPPPHDDFDAARLMSPMPYSNSVDVSGATTASDDPEVSDCGGYGLVPGMASVWYRYTPAVNTSLRLDTEGSTYDTYVAVWQGTRASPVLVACNDDVQQGVIRHSSLLANLTAGTTYRIQVAEYTDDLVVASAAQIDDAEGTSLASPGGDTEDSHLRGKPQGDVEAQAGGTLQFHASVLTAPTLQSRYPASATTACRRPQAGVDLLLTDLVRTASGSFDASKVTLRLDGVNLTSQAQIRVGLTSPASRATILYQSTADLTLGTHQVQFTYPGVSGPMTQTWNFTAANITCGTTLTMGAAEPTASIGAEQPSSVSRELTSAAAPDDSVVMGPAQAELAVPTVSSAGMPAADPAQLAQPQVAPTAAAAPQPFPPRVQTPTQPLRGFPHPGLYYLLLNGQT